MLMKKIYLLTTEHLEGRLWFRDEEDFKVAMNYVAIESARSPSVTVLAFILMSNHVHFVLYGELEGVQTFLNSFKQRYSLYYRRKYGVKEFLRRNTLDIKYISQEAEGVERAIAYVQMNCVSANICSHPSQYPWGTGNCFFNQSLRAGKTISGLSIRARRRLLHSQDVILPGDWKICEEGYVMPSEYVDINLVKSIFRTPKRMNYFLMRSSKAKKGIGLHEDNLPAFRDQTILAALPDLCRSLFQKESFSYLLPEEKEEFVKQIRFRFSADATQIARVCGISYSEAAKLLDSI